MRQAAGWAWLILTARTRIAGAVYEGLHSDAICTGEIRATRSRPRSMRRASMHIALSTHPDSPAGWPAHSSRQRRHLGRTIGAEMAGHVLNDFTAKTYCPQGWPSAARPNLKAMRKRPTRGRPRAIIRTYQPLPIRCDVPNRQTGGLTWGLVTASCHTKLTAPGVGAGVTLQTSDSEVPGLPRRSQHRQLGLVRTTLC